MNMRRGKVVLDFLLELWISDTPVWYKYNEVLCSLTPSECSYRQDVVISRLLAFIA